MTWLIYTMRHTKEPKFAKLLSFKRSSTLRVLSSAFICTRSFAMHSERSNFAKSRVKVYILCMVHEITQTNSACFRETSSDHSQLE